MGGFLTPKWIFGGACLTAAGVGATYLACREDQKSTFSIMAVPAALAGLATLGGAAAYLCKKSRSTSESFSEDSSDSAATGTNSCNTRSIKRPSKKTKTKPVEGKNDRIIYGALALMLVIVAVIFYSQNSASEEEEFDL